MYLSECEKAVSFFYLILTGGYIFKTGFQRERKVGRKERERRHQLRGETLMECLPYAPGPGVEPNPQPECPDWESDCNLLGYGMMLPLTVPPGQGKSVYLVFTTNPAQLMVRLKVCQFFNTSPATLAGVRPCSFLLYQLCF